METTQVSVARLMDKKRCYASMLWSLKKQKNRTSEQTQKRNEVIDTENKQAIAKG